MRTIEGKAGRKGPSQISARITWLLLWPVLVVVGLFDLTVLALTCGDNGLADYGDPDAMQFCRRIDQQETDFFLIGFVPLVVLVAGTALWLWPAWLRWLNGLAFVLAGVVAAALSLVATATALAVVLAVAWWLILVVALVLGRDARSPTAGSRYSPRLIAMSKPNSSSGQSTTAATADNTLPTVPRLSK